LVELNMATWETPVPSFLSFFNLCRHNPQTNKTQYTQPLLIEGWVPQQESLALFSPRRSLDRFVSISAMLIESSCSSVVESWGPWWTRYH
jgi:hypothetical protein